MLSSYTFSKAITNAPQFRNAGGADGSENSPGAGCLQPAAERGLASFHLKHRWVNSGVYNLPFGPNQTVPPGGLGEQGAGGMAEFRNLQHAERLPVHHQPARRHRGRGRRYGRHLHSPEHRAGQNWQLSGDRTEHGSLLQYRRLRCAGDGRIRQRRKEHGHRTGHGEPGRRRSPELRISENE